MPRRIVEAIAHVPALPRIFLVGLMGAGKTTVGRSLAQRTGLRFADSDHEIERRRGLTVSEIFAQEGEAGFRDLEQQVIDEFTRQDGLVLATGGGAVLRDENRRALHDRGTVVYLRAGPDELAHRMRNDRVRPLLRGGDPRARLRDLFRQRDPLYRESAHFVIETGRPSPSMLTQLVLAQLELAGVVPASRT